MMHVMQQYSSQIYNAVRDLARHMTKPAPKHTTEMLHCMKHMADRPNCGLVLAPIQSWDVSNDFKFRVSGKSYSDYVKEPVDRRSVSGSVVQLERSQVIFRSRTQNNLALSVTEAELYAAVSTTQDMLYTMNVLLSLGLSAKLRMMLEVGNMGAVHLANNWSLSGRTRHIDVDNVFFENQKRKT